MEQLPPLSLYVHIPWCVRKCPYCDFNSHRVRGELDAEGYIDALLVDLSYDLKRVGYRPLQSIFIGGGTPSLFAPSAIARLLAGVKKLVAWNEPLEITLEANPGTLEATNLAGYRDAGVNRLSIGVQSFSAECLQALGRIHGPDEAVKAVEQARRAGFERLNLDLMFGLPVQTPAIASADLQTALALDPGHLSYYQLTIEPNTGFHRIPPKLPGEDEIWQTQLQGQAALAAAGYTQYEVSAYALTGQRCRHNLNYWSFGDYLGIGAGAHGKLTDRSGSVLRFSKWRHPEKYLAQVKQGRAIYNQRLLTEGDLILEFLMNQFRLLEGFDRSIFIQRTGLPVSLLEPGIKLARAKGLLNGYGNCIETTPLGRRFLNDLLVLFLPD